MKSDFERFSRTVTMLIAFAFCVMCLTSCNGGDAEPLSEPSLDESSESPQSVQSEEPSEASEPGVDFGGEVFTVIGNWYGYDKTNTFGIGEVIWSEDGNVKTVDTAKREAVLRVETAYGCKIEEKQLAIGNGTLADYITVDALSGVSSVDILFESPYYCTDLVLSGRLTDLSKLTPIDLTAEWWDGSNVDLTVNGKQYFANGSINLSDDGNTWCILFNETMYNGLGRSETLYDSVRQGTWTFDKLIGLAAEVTNDTVNDGILNEFDTWGFGSEMNGLYCHVSASGENSVVKTESGELALNVCGDRTKTLLDQVAAAYKTDAVLVANDGSFSHRYDNVFAETTEKAFADRRELFLLGTVSDLAVYSGKTTDKIGVLPLPKGTADQSEYCSPVEVFNSSALMIPKTSPDKAEKTATVVEALAKSFHETVVSEYVGYLTADSETEQMLAKIAETRVYDLGSVFALDLGFPTNLYQLPADKTAQEYFQLKEMTIYNCEQAIAALNEKIKSLN